MLAVDALDSRGSGLSRPECVLATATGDLYTADWRGGVVRIAPDGTQTLYRGELPDARPLRPNGIAMERDGSFLLADLGETLGGVFRLERSGRVSPVVTEVGGTPLPPTNFVLLDASQRLWITVSTSRVPRASAYRSDVADGFVVLVDERGSRVVADGLGYTNEVALDPSGRFLYVNETFARRTSRFEVGAQGLGPRETFVDYGEGTYPRRSCVRRGRVPVGGLDREQPRAAHRAGRRGSRPGSRTRTPSTYVGSSPPTGRTRWAARISTP